MRQFHKIYSFVFLLSLIIILFSVLFVEGLEPGGPFYGFPFSTKVARRLPIPSTAFGSCEEGKVYTITKTEDLRKYEAEIQCVFTAGLTPSKIPEGPQYARVLLALNSFHFIINPLVNLLWRGNFAFKTECNSTTSESSNSRTRSRFFNQNRNSSRNSRPINSSSVPNDPTQIYIGFHNILGRALLPGILYIAPLKGNFALGEHEDNKPSIVLDFTQDLTKVCPDYEDFVSRNKSNLPIQVTSLSNFFPQTQIFDVFRLVGRQRDGGKIYLGKTYLRDAFRADKQMATIAFWYAVNYDNQVSPDFQIGQALPPLPQSYQYIFPGVIDFILRTLPFDNLLTRPFGTLLRLGNGARKTSQAFWLNFREFRRQLGQYRGNRRRLRKYWQSGRKQRTFEDVQ